MYRSPPPPVDVETLPRALRAEMRASIRTGHAVGAKGALERWGEKNDETAPVCVALAWALFEDAVDMLPDRVLPDGERALALLDRALALGASERKLAALRARITKAVRRERVEETKLRALLEAGKLDEQGLGRVAFRLGRGGAADKRRAARIYQRLAAEAASERARISARRNAAWFVAETGGFDEACADLERIVTGEIATGDATDVNYVELALHHLVGAAAKARDGRELVRLFETGRATIARIPNETEGGPVFPYNPGLLEAWLVAALDLDLRDLGQALLDAHDRARRFWSKTSVDAKVVERARKRWRTAPKRQR